MKTFYSPRLLLRTCSFLTVFFTISTVFAQANFDYRYSKIIGNTNSMNPWSMFVDDNSNVYMAGTFADTLDADPGPGTYNLISKGYADCYVIKLDSSGQFLWAFSVGNVANGGYSVKLCSGGSGSVVLISADLAEVDYDHGPGTFILGSPIDEQTLVAAWYDATNGDFINAFELHEPSLTTGPSAFCHDARCDASGNLYVSGAFIGGTLDFDAGTGTEFESSGLSHYAMFFGKYSSTGNVLWMHALDYTSGENNHANALDLDASGNIYITGVFGGTVDFDPGAGTTLLNAGSGYAMHIAKYSGSGNFIWAKNASSTNAVIGKNLKIDSDGNIVITGYLYGTADMDPSAGNYSLSSSPSKFDCFIAKYDTSGNFDFAHSMPSGSTGPPIKNGLAIDSDNNYYVSGTFSNYIDLDGGPGTDVYVNSGATDGFVAKYNSTGDYADGIIYTGYTGSRQVWDIATDAYDNVDVNGSVSQDTLVLGDDTLVPTGYSDNAFLVKYAPGLSLGLEEMAQETKSRLKVYPNPNNGHFNLELENEGSVYVYNALGELVHETLLPTGKNNLSLAQLPKGIYLVKVLGTRVNELVKIVKQ